VTKGQTLDVGIVSSFDQNGICIEAVTQIAQREKSEDERTAMSGIQRTRAVVTAGLKCTAPKQGGQGSGDLASPGGDSGLGGAQEKCTALEYSGQGSELESRYPVR
jgi:hypothetical protein